MVFVHFCLIQILVYFFQSADIEFIWFMIKSLIFKAMSLFIPKMLIRRCQSPKWFNSEIRHYQKCLRSMRRRLKAHPTLQRLNKVKHMENLLQSKLIQAIKLALKLD